jgi:peptidoglycan/xylan/chitin deacetylase (PgdA/CDA1 family)
MMTWDEVRTVSDLTWIGGHSHTHPILSRLTRDDLEREIGTCRDRIAAETGRTPTMFAYPNGTPADYNGETQAVLKRHGFNLAFSTTEGMVGPNTDWMAIPRIFPMADSSLANFAWRIAGMHLYLLSRQARRDAKCANSLFRCEQAPFGGHRYPL